jgi:hypothetical protein
MTDDVNGPLDRDSPVGITLWAPAVVVLFHWLMEVDFTSFRSATQRRSRR